MKLYDGLRSRSKDNKNFYNVLYKELTTYALDLSSSELKPTQPYPDSLAVKSFSIWTFKVEKSSYIACEK